MTQFLQDPEMQAVLIHVVDSEGDPLCGTAEVPAETITEDHWTEGLSTAQDVARLCPACDKQASERARAAHAAQQQERAAETKRQATAAFVVAVDLAKAGGLSHAECHAVVDSRPHTRA